MSNQSDNEDMADRSISPFGSSKAPSSTRGGGIGRSNLSPVNEEMSDSSNPFGGAMSSSGDDRLKAKREEKKNLQAMIEEKKKKLMERKNKKKQQKEASLNANAAPFVPPASADASLAGRSAMRFARHLGGSSSPQTPPRPAVSGGEVNKTETRTRQDLENAVSLVGTCRNMCPDDELQRREREADIQLLEVVKPGTIHPQDWTLTDTAVKRFRRSAADYKLDVPEWVRPPDVLEKVCAYLEEWVMVRTEIMTSKSPLL